MAKHGSPFDRGGADFWYRRPAEPHYWPDGTGHGTKITEAEMTAEQIEEYYDGYEEAEEIGDQKEW